MLPPDVKFKMNHIEALLDATLKENETTFVLELIDGHTTHLEDQRVVFDHIDCYNLDVEQPNMDPICVLQSLA